MLPPDLSSRRAPDAGEYGAKNHEGLPSQADKETDSQAKRGHEEGVLPFTAEPALQYDSAISYFCGTPEDDQRVVAEKRSEWKTLFPWQEGTYDSEPESDEPNG